jgi:hypothetical protein
MFFRRWQGASVRFTASMLVASLGAVFWLFVVLGIVGMIGSN